MKTLLLAFIAMVVASFPAQASADGSLLARLGYLGYWAYDCDKPPSGDNPHYFLEAPANGVPTERLLTAGDHDRVHTVTDVKELPGGLTQWTQTEPDGTAVILLKQRENKRARTWSSEGRDGKVYIKDGHFLESGKEVRWFYRCAAG